MVARTTPDAASRSEPRSGSSCAAKPGTDHGRIQRAPDPSRAAATSAGGRSHTVTTPSAAAAVSEGVARCPQSTSSAAPKARNPALSASRGSMLNATPARSEYRGTPNGYPCAARRQHQSAQAQSKNCATVHDAPSKAARYSVAQVMTAARARAAGRRASPTAAETSPRKGRTCDRGTSTGAASEPQVAQTVSVPRPAANSAAQSSQRAWPHGSHCHAARIEGCAVQAVGGVGEIIAGRSAPAAARARPPARPDSAACTSRTG